MRRFLAILILWAITGSCAVLHKVQLGDQYRVPSSAKPVSIRVSETTVNIAEAADIARAVSGSKTTRQLGEAADLYTTFFQFGPRTGTPVYNEFYARDLAERLVKQCPGGRVTNVISLRETRSYPVVKGEIIRLDGQCIR